MKNSRLVLVIDDDPDFQAFMEWKLGELGYSVCSVSDPRQIEALLKGRSPQVILLDWQLGDVDGTLLIEHLRHDYPLSSVIFATAHSTPELAAAVIKLGAFDFLTKPIDLAKLEITLANASTHFELLDRLKKIEEKQENEGVFEGIIGVSPQIRTVFSIIRNVASTDVNVMICGESGTGKELVASAIHHLSDRSTGPFVALNMASIPADLAEATLFGHEKGAFTGADRERPGAVGEAAGGTLFLDEITEMPIALQGKLLRFLQQRTYRPVGGRKDLNSNVRIVSATNRDPLKAVEEKQLREDLYYRLNVVPISLPPLRERDGDVELLTNHMLRQFSQQYSKRFESVDPEAMRQLTQYDWPGNVRQLIHLMQRVVILNDGERLTSRMLPTELFHNSNTASLFQRAGSGSAAGQSTSDNASTPVGSESSSVRSEPTDDDAIIPLEELERRAIEHAIRRCGGSAYEAASRLGISTATIYRKIKHYHIESS